MTRKSEDKSKGQPPDNKSRKSHVLAMVMQFESKAAEATESPKMTPGCKNDKTVEMLALPDNSTSGQVNLSEDRYAPASINSRPLPANRPFSVRSFGSARTNRSLMRSATRDLMKLVKKRFYGQPPSERSRAWVMKVLKEVFTVLPKVKDKTALTPSNDGSGDDLETAVDASHDQSQVAPPPATEDTTEVSGDTSKDEKDLKEPEDEEEQYRFFCKQMATILEQASGFPVADIGLSLADFRALLQQCGLTSAQQLLAESSKMRLLYEPQVIVLGNQTQISQREPGQVLPEPDDSTLPSQAKSVHVLSEEVYFYPNKLTFQ